MRANVSDFVTNPSHQSPFARELYVTNQSVKLLVAFGRPARKVQSQALTCPDQVRSRVASAVQDLHHDLHGHDSKGAPRRGSLEATRTSRTEVRSLATSSLIRTSAIARFGQTETRKVFGRVLVANGVVRHVVVQLPLRRFGNKVTLPFGKRVSWESANTPWTLQPCKVTKGNR